VLVRFKEISQTTAETLSYKERKLKEQMKGEIDERMRREGKKTKGTTQYTKGWNIFSLHRGDDKVTFSEV
jgi:hypothetical protein